MSLWRCGSCGTVHRNVERCECSHGVHVVRGSRGGWRVYLDGQFISDHATHEAARTAAANHLRA